ncbi:MAG: cyclic nucleotide-binding domain-containing protein [Chrysiogenetes bacterium]|nr:cyclic nucleotide-binding domain-containing protein [Chrysiogenetes bacterium]
MVSKDRLKGIRLFSGFSDEDLERAAGYMVEKFYPKGEPIIRNKTIGEGIHFIYSGKVQIVRGGISNGDVVIAELGPGQHVGEMALIDNKPTTAKVIAADAVVTYFLDRIKYRTLVDNHPAVAVQMLNHFCKSFCERLRATNDLLIDEKQMNKSLAARLEVDA